MVGLALEGGGAKGAYQAGAYLALKKCHIKIDAVVGTSIGSFNAAMIASHEEDKMASLWLDTTMSELLGIDEEKAMAIYKGNINSDNIKWSFKTLGEIFKNKGLDISNYRALVRNNVNEKKLRKSKIKYGLTTVKLNSLETMEVYLDDIEEGKVHDYIVASSYLPVFKQTKLVDGSNYLDGGFFNLSPTDMLAKLGCDEIYVVNIKGVGFRKKNNLKNIDVIEIKPKGNLGSILLFDKKSNKDNMRYGYLDTMRVLGKIDGFNYYFYKKKDRYYKKINKKIDLSLKKIVYNLVNANNDKECTIKAVEYILEKEGKSDLNKYKIEKVIKDIKKIKSDNIIYRYVKGLK